MASTSLSIVDGTTTSIHLSFKPSPDVVCRIGPHAAGRYPPKAVKVTMSKRVPLVGEELAAYKEEQKRIKKEEALKVSLMILSKRRNQEHLMGLIPLRVIQWSLMIAVPMLYQMVFNDAVECQTVVGITVSSLVKFTVMLALNCIEWIELWL